MEKFGKQVRKEPGFSVDNLYLEYNSPYYSSIEGCQSPLQASADGGIQFHKS